jgi:hypothetical protein
MPQVEPATSNDTQICRNVRRNYAVAASVEIRMQ